MTIRELFEKRLYEHGLFEDQARAIINQHILNEGPDSPLTGRWESDSTGYPDVLYNVLWMSIKHTAHDWLREHKPQHWALPIFDPNDPIHAQTDKEATSGTEEH